jgi:nucleoside-diphosphate-sugar epimerase
MKILVVGGAGFIGCILVPKLAERGYQVDVVDLLWFGNNLPEGTKVVRKDSLSLTEDELVGYDQVIFLAGLSNDPMAEYSPSRNFVSNAATPSYLAYICKRAGAKRYVYASSCSVYGYSPDRLYDEESPAVSNYPYGISKLQGEFGALQLRDSGFSVICLRKGTVCGYSPRMRLDLVVNTMFKTAVKDKMINVNNPSIWRPIVAIQDAVAAYIRAVEASPDTSGVFNIASGNYTIGEIADYVQKGVKKYLDMHAQIKVMHQTDLRNYKVSVEKAVNVLGFKPTYTIEEIVKDLVEQRDKFSDFENPNYYNIEVFKRVLSTT